MVEIKDSVEKLIDFTEKIFAENGMKEFRYGETFLLSYRIFYPGNNLLDFHYNYLKKSFQKEKSDCIFVYFFFLKKGHIAILRRAKKLEPLFTKKGLIFQVKSLPKKRGHFLSHSVVACVEEMKEKG